MDHVMEKRFMSEITGAKRLTFDRTDRYILYWVCLAGDKVTQPPTKSQWFGYGLSAYMLWRQLEGTLSYKNVRKRMQKFKRLGLIEEIKEKDRYRNAIKYKASTLAIFHGFLVQEITFVPDLHINKNSTLLQVILYKYFEPETIDEFYRYYAVMYLDRYVKRCCELILDAIENKRFPVSFSGIESLIEQEIKNLVFNIVVISNIVIEDKDDPDFKSIFPIDMLAKDKKFRPMLLNIKKEFDAGFQRFT